MAVQLAAGLQVDLSPGLRDYLKHVGKLQLPSGASQTKDMLGGPKEDPLPGRQEEHLCPTTDKDDGGAHFMQEQQDTVTPHPEKAESNMDEGANDEPEDEYERAKMVAYESMSDGKKQEVDANLKGFLDRLKSG
eukprot:SAG31_NODE_24006_length_491_cov_0.910714_1_plen_133_part_10